MTLAKTPYVPQSAEYHGVHLALLRTGIVEAAARREPILDRLHAYTAEVMRAERDRLYGLSQKVLIALDAEKTPNYEIGHDRAVDAALEMQGFTRKPIKARMVPLDEL